MGKIDKPKIKLERVDEAVVDKYLLHYGLDRGGDLAARCARLQAHMEKVAKQDISECDNCKGLSDIRLPVCAYCGVGDDEAQLESAVANNPNATIKSEEPVREKKTDKPKPEKPAKSDSKPTSTAIQQVEPAELLSVKDLDKSVERINKLKRGAVVSYWHLGHAIKENYEKRLFTLRQEDGKPKYKAFNQFCIQELGMSPSQAYILMDVAVNFTEEDVATIGVSKLRVIARMSPADRDEIMTRVRDGNAPLSEVEEEIRRRVGGVRRLHSGGTAGGPGLRGGQSVGARGTAASAAKATITVGIALGQTVIPMVRAGAPDRSAATLNHEPMCTETMLNGVVIEYRVIKNDDGLALVIVRKQDKAAMAAANEPKKRGRPPKNKTAPSVGEAAPKKKRGRPPKK